MRLGLGDADEAVPGIARLVEDDGQLGGLARARRALDDDDLVVLERLEDSLLLLVDGELAWIHALF